MHYFRIWKQLASCAIQSTLSNRIDSLGYLLGKLVRFGFFWLFLVSIFQHTSDIAGYSKYEVLLFYVTYNLMDILPQIFFRGIYWFRHDVMQGNFDFVLVKPVKPLFYTLSRFTDLLDMIFIVPVLFLFVFVISKLGASISLFNAAAYLIFLVFGFITVLAIHILSASITMRTLESENFIWAYRGAMTMGTFPPEIFSNTVKYIFTFGMPIMIIVAFPAKALLGMLSLQWGIIGAIYSLLFFSFSIWLWNRNLKYYSSASS